jgi:hypothetical protein
MENRNYWVDLVTWKTWQEFLAAGASVSGFRERRWKTVQKIKPGDYLLCYLTGLSRWIGVLEVVSPPFMDKTRRWEDDVFPCRVRTQLIVGLAADHAVPIIEIKDQLSIFEHLKNPNAWTASLRGSPSKWSTSDGQAVYAAVMEAKKNPVARPIDPRKLKALDIQAIGENGVTVPPRTSADNKIHTEMQWLLLKLGSDMGLDVWVARNDRGREWAGQRFSELTRLRKELPLQFDEATNKTIELIDVLWLRGNAIVAAFEIEATTSIYSGLLRMSDLISMQPNLNIPLFLVAPDERRQKVFIEVNRPTFFRLSPPMAEICRYIPFSALSAHIQKAEPYVRYLKPEFLDELSEACEVGSV